MRALQRQGHLFRMNKCPPADPPGDRICRRGIAPNPLSESDIWRFLFAAQLAISRYTLFYSQLGSDATGGDETSICQCLVVGLDRAYYFWGRGSH
jgi:hypothetical protein